MLNAIRLHTRVDSDVLRIPELLPLVGRCVEIIIIEDESSVEEAVASRRPRLGTLQGMVEVPDDFDAPLPEDLVRAFEGHG
jgi:hypothetical protein